VADIAQDDDIRAVIVTGAGRGFCSGADLNRNSGNLSRRERTGFLGPNFASEVFYTINKPVIAAINGACVGAGFSLALSTDIRIASDKAKFGAVFILRGLTPDCGITYWLPRLVGTSKAMEMMLTGEIIYAEEATRLGITSKIVPANKLMESARELAGRIVKQAPLSVELSKMMVYRGITGDVARQVELETLGNRITTSSEDHRAAVRAFLEKQPQPEFKGW